MNSLETILKSASMKVTDVQISNMRELIDAYIQHKALETMMTRINGTIDALENEEMKLRGLSEFARDLGNLLENSGQK